MALINCSECGKQISDKAEFCPSCGNPIKQTKETTRPNPAYAQPKRETVYIQQEKKSGGGVWGFVGILIAIILIIIIIFSM